jgi:hypothetical protein
MATRQMMVSSKTLVLLSFIYYFASRTPSFTQ